MFAARTLLAPAPAPARVVDEQLGSLRRRWNQHGIEALVSAAGDPDGVLVRYRLTIAPGHPDASAVHAAFRDDLDRALAALTDRLEPPAAWDLASLAAAADERAQAPPTPRAYAADTDYDWP